ncbi:Translation machinery-associated protein 16 [Oopsacas minuta]|uniref:Translation machinery-associated protein 16 n=1 Tax=Oopsacas minuta TaxID=111878 RepID=A0AAV7KL20_9METZ|nr:Translation machinery-associated protein 16 [Oopsacas minuta]
MGNKGKQTNKQLHPHSRKLKQLSKKIIHKNKQEKQQQTKYISNTFIVNKLKWFQTEMDQSKEVFSISEICQLIERYLLRFDTQLKPELTPKYSYKSSCKLDGTRMTIEREMELFSTIGLEAPDLTNKNVVTFLKEWNGDIKWLQSHIPLKRFCCQAN